MLTEIYRRRPIVIWAALLFPLLLAWSGWRLLKQSVGISQDAAQFDRELARREPEVIVFGSSLANRGVDIPVLARSLGLPEQKVMLMQLPHSSEAHWYAMLKNRVFANGHRPKLVLVVDAFTSMLNHDLLHEMQMNVDRLVAQMTANEPEIATKVFRIEDPEEFRTYFVRQRASEYRQSLLNAYRDQVIGYVYARKGKADEAEKIVERVNEEVFANDRMDYSLHGEAATGLFAATKIAHTDAGDYDLKRDALLPEMAALAAQYDTNVVYVRIPLPPSNGDMDYVPPDIEADAVDWIEELGDIYLDMRALDLDDSMFEDMRHLSRQGSQIFTSALGRVLASIRALESGASSRAIKGLEKPSSVVVDGETAALPPIASAIRSADGCRLTLPAGPWAALDRDFQRDYGSPPLPIQAAQAGQPLLGSPGEGCVGGVWIEGGQIVISPRDPNAAVELSYNPEPAAPPPEGEEPLPVRWILPGTKVTWTFAEPWSLPENAFRVYVRAFAVGGADVPLQVKVGDDAFDLQSVAGRVSGSGKPNAPSAPGWTLSIEVPAGGPTLMVHHLAIGAPPSTAFVYGEAETLHGSSIRVVGGRVEDTQHKAVFATPPPALPSQPRIRRAMRDEAVFQMDKLADLADSESRDAQKPNKCTPVAVLEDGKPLPLPHSSCPDVVAQGAGRSCFAGDTLIFSASDDTDPMTNNRVYQAVLSPRRLCDVYGQKQSAFLRDSWWYYPGDVGEFTIGADELASFRDGANLIEMEMMPHVGEVESPVRVVVTAGDTVVLDKTWTPAGMHKRQRMAWRLDPPLLPRPGDLKVRIENTSTKSFLLLTSLAVSESYDMFGTTGAASGGAALSATPALIDGSVAQDDVLATWERLGAPPPTPEPKKGQMTNFGAFEAKLFPLWPISDSYLEKLQLPLASPARLYVDGRMLKHIGDRKEFRAGCEDCFYHTGQSFIFFAKQVSKDSVPSVDLDPALPMDNGTGTLAYWVYPSTTVKASLPGALAAGTAQVTVQAIAFHPQKESVGRGVLLRVGDQSVQFAEAGADGAVHAVLDIRGGAAPVIEVESQQPGNTVLLRSMRVQDARGVHWLIRPPAEG